MTSQPIGVAGKLTVIAAYPANLASFLTKKFIFSKIYPIQLRTFFLFFSDTTGKEEDITVSKKVRERVRERGQQCTAVHR